MKKIKNSKILICISVILLMAIFFIPFKKEEKLPPLKNDYSIDEIINKIYDNYLKIKTVKITFSDQWQNEKGINHPFSLEIDKAVLYDIMHNNQLKIKSKKISLMRDFEAKIWGDYKTTAGQKKYYQLINWLICVYDASIILPLKLDLNKIKALTEIKKTKTEQNGIYSLAFSLNNSTIKMSFDVNMNYGTIERSKIIEQIQITNSKKKIEHYPYIIKSEFKDIQKFNDIYFPAKVKVTYLSRDDKFSFSTRLNKIKFNKRINKKTFTLKEKKNNVVWYNDPQWLNKENLVLIKGKGSDIKNEYGKIKILGKDFYIITRNIKNGKEEIIRHILSSDERKQETRFIFSADYNKKYNILAYSIIPSNKNSNPIMEDNKGLYLFHMKKKKSVKISTYGFSPKWSDNYETLIWNEPDQGNMKNSLNNIWSFNLRDKKKKIIIKNGFHYQWIDNTSIIFEKGNWQYLSQYKTINKKKTQETGLYHYDFKSQQITLLNSFGHYPCIHQDLKKVVFAGTGENSGIYILDLKKKETSRIIQFEHKDKIIPPVWYGKNDILYIKTTGPNVIKYGLYKYSLKNHSYELMSNRIGLKNDSHYYLDTHAQDNRILYKLYTTPDWDYTAWGIFNFNSKKIDMEDSSFL